MKKHLLALTISSLFTISANAAVSGCPSGWVKSGDGKECVLTEKVDTPAIGTSDTTRPICINGFTYESATNKCSKTVNANTTNVSKIYEYKGNLVFGSVRTVVTGDCGSADRQAVTSQPTGTQLCYSGQPSSVSGVGPWTWTCFGEYGGSSDYCTADKKFLPSISYPEQIGAFQTFTWGISGAKPNSSWTVYNVPWLNGGQIGPHYVNSFGSATYNDGNISTPGTYTFNWIFSDGATATKTVRVTDPVFNHSFRDSVIDGLSHIVITGQSIAPIWGTTNYPEYIGGHLIPLLKYDNVLYTTSLKGLGVSLTDWFYHCFSNGSCGRVTGCIQTHNYKIRVCGGSWIDLFNTQYQYSVLPNVYHIETQGGSIRVVNGTKTGAWIRYWPY